MEFWGQFIEKWVNLEKMKEARRRLAPKKMRKKVAKKRKRKYRRKKLFKENKLKTLTCDSMVVG